MNRPLKVMVVAAQPVQYTAPLYRACAADPDIDLRVVFCSMQGVEAGYDEGFGITVEWDVPLLDGYASEHSRNWSHGDDLNTLMSRVNPGVWSAIRRWRPDVVVCWGYRAISDWIAFAAARLSGAKFLWSCEASHWASREPRGWKPAIKKWLIPRIYRAADGVLCTSTVASNFVRDLGVAPSKIFFMAHGVDNSFFQQRAGQSDRKIVRKSWGVGNDAVVALQCGKLIPYKRPMDMVEVASRLDWLHVVFAGEGELRPSLEARVRELGLGERVHFIGFVNQGALPGTYAAADFLVVPSEWENQPLVVPEAMASGIPVVATDTCAVVGDLVIDDETGFVTKVGDFDMLTDRVAKLGLDEDIRRRFEKQVHAKIARWGPDQSALGFASACVEVARGDR